MAETVNSDLIIYNEQTQTAYLERLQDVLEVFGTQSAGALQFRSESIIGNIKEEAFYKIGGEIVHRDVNATTTVTPASIDADDMTGVKVPWKYGPYASTEEAFKRRGRSIEEFSQLIGADMADAMLAGWIEYSLSALQAAIGGNANMNVTASLATDGKKALTKGLRKMGDRFTRTAIWVMDSEMYFDVVDQAIDNKVYEEAGLVIYGGMPGTMGKPILVTDRAPSGIIFGLQAGAIIATESQAPGVRSYQINDKENLAIGIRAEGTFNLDVMGYSWKVDPGGINPNLAAVAAEANWGKHATSDKVTAGFIIDLNGASS